MIEVVKTEITILVLVFLMILNFCMSGSKQGTVCHDSKRITFQWIVKVFCGINCKILYKMAKIGSQS